MGQRPRRCVCDAATSDAAHSSRSCIRFAVEHLCHWRTGRRCGSQNRRAFRSVKEAVESVASLTVARAEFAALADGLGRIFAIGGTDGTSIHASVEMFDPSVGTWTTVAPMLEPRMMFAATVGPDGKFYVFGGVGPLGATAHAEVYDPTANTWSPRPDVPVTAFLSSAFVWQRFIVVTGGVLDGNVSTDGYVFDTSDQVTWKKSVGLLSKPRIRPAVGVVEAATYVFGGINVPFETDIEKIETVPSTAARLSRRSPSALAQTTAPACGETAYLQCLARASATVAVCGGASGAMGVLGCAGAASSAADQCRKADGCAAGTHCTSAGCCSNAQGVCGDQCFDPMCQVCDMSSGVAVISEKCDATWCQKCVKTSPDAFMNVVGFPNGQCTPRAERQLVASDDQCCYAGDENVTPSVCGVAKNGDGVDSIGECISCQHSSVCDYNWNTANNSVCGCCQAGGDWILYFCADPNPPCNK